MGSSQETTTRDLQQLADMVKWDKMPELHLVLRPQAGGLSSLGPHFP